MSSGSERLKRYEVRESYEWNYANPAEPPVGVSIPPSRRPWAFCGLPVNSPLGIPAGPLLNSGWIRYYARLGFDVLTYKTVRSRARASYDLPNLLPVLPTVLRGSETDLAEAAEGDYDSWAISFGMPSRAPEVWRADVAEARRALAPGQVLVVSVVGSPERDWTVDQLAEDYVRCAVWAVEAGAHAVEANLSCPNVTSCEGEVYLSPELSGTITRAMRRALGSTPLILKVGIFPDDSRREAFVRSVQGHATAVSTANTVSAHVRSRDGGLLFGGLKRGIGGRCVAERCFEELVGMARVRDRVGATVRLIAVGGVSGTEEVKARLNAGAENVQIATAAMLDPTLGIRLREGLAASAE